LTKFQAERLLEGRSDGFHLGPYFIQEQVGRGSLGRVYKARHRTMNRLVAIKVLAPEFTRTTADRQALQREVRAAAQLNHTNIVTAYDVNEMGDRHYLVLEFVDGPNLETLVRERGLLPVAQACEIVRQIAVGLSQAHSLGLAHWDIKPGNLLLARTSSLPGFAVKIADFGLAKLAPSHQTQQGKLSGNPDYIAPERARHLQSADYRADLYSLGAVLYFLLAGQPPFAGGTPEEKVCRHLLEEPVRIECWRADVHPAVAALVHQLLAKHPQYRPSSAAEVAERLECAPVGHAINLEFPVPNVGPYSFVGGQLSGRFQVPQTQQVQEQSGRYAQPDSGAYHIATQPAENSPWEQITDSHRASDTPVQIVVPHGKAHSHNSIWKVGGVFAGMLLMSLVAIGIVVKMMVK
jgi:serine/threonine-protein kinase